MQKGKNMSKKFNKLMREQIQDSLNGIMEFANRSIPKKGWVRTIRDALGITSTILADRLKCSRSNIASMEKSEIKGSISLATLEQVAKAMDCKLVYCFVPIESLDKILENQARKIAKKRIKIVNHSMRLEQQGLNPKQLKQEEDDLVREMLQGNIKDLWRNDEF